MAVLNITEYDQVAMDRVGRVIMCGLEPRVTVQNVTYTTATASAAFHARTQFIRIISTEDCWFTVGLSPTATVNNGTRIEAFVAEFFGIIAGQSYKLSVYDGIS